MRHMCGFFWESRPFHRLMLRSRHIIGFSCVLLACQAALAETPYFSFMPAPDSTSRVIQLKPARDGDEGSIRVLIEAFQKMNLKKGEFETTSEFESRLKQIMSEDLIPGIRTGDSLAVVIPADSDEWVYEADRNELSLNWELSRYALCYIHSAASNVLSYWRHVGYTTLFKTLDVSVSKPETHEGMNSFGAKAMITSLTRTEWAIAVDQERPSHLPRVRTVPFPSIPMSRNDAQLLKGHLQIIAVGKVNLENPVLIHASRKEATVRDPVEETVVTYILNMRPQEVFLVRPDTGAVLLREVLKDGNDVFVPVGATSPDPVAIAPQAAGSPANSSRTRPNLKGR